jgi:hypothetical protein
LCGGRGRRDVVSASASSGEHEEDGENDDG